MNTRCVCLVSFVALVLLLPASAIYASNLNNSFVFRGVDIAAFGNGGIRGIGSGQITVTGVSGDITAAYFYWHGPTNSADPTVLEDAVFDGNNITGSFLGISESNCWAPLTNSYAYRANVTSIVTGNGVYPFSFPGFVLDNIDLNGASLVVIFDDGNDANNHDVAIFDGNDSNVTNAYDADGWNATLEVPAFVAGSVSLLLIVSDGQYIAPDIGLDDQLLIDGTEVLPLCGTQYSGDTVPNGAGCPFGAGCLWDHVTADITALVNPGGDTLLLTTNTCAVFAPPEPDDCVSLVVAVFILPEGALEYRAIPALGTAGIVVLGLLILTIGVILVRRMTM